MDKNTLRRMAGITTVSEQLSAPGYTPSFNASEFRRLAGLPTYPTAIPEAAEEEEVPAEDEESVEEPDSAEAEPTMQEIIAKIASHAEGKTQEELIPLFTKAYEAGLADAANKEESEESSEDLDIKPKE